MTQRAPSSTFVTYAWIHHVFLSFRGVDTRFGFTNNLHQALVGKGIRSFIDHEELQVGEEISPALAKAIEESRIAIIVFSENYASSTFCLEELVRILECIKQKGRLVWPIFYKVDPSNVRHQIGSYKEALEKHKERFNSHKIQKWKAALYEIANLKGEHFSGNEYEHDFIARIVQQASRLINRQALHISANYPVGLESRVQNVISLLDGTFDGVKCMVGICGVGGIGKSTIARAVFNLIADQFEGVCFLADVRENSFGNKGLVQLQQTLLFEILGGPNMEFTDVNKGSEIIRDRLQQKKVLLILDDIDKLKQLRTLAGGLDWFGTGSRIIITTRDKHLLHVHGVERIYGEEGLNDAEAYELFNWNAFKRNEVDPCYMDISKRAVRYCQGLPLALDIIGCNLFGKEPEECNSALDTYERNPNKDIQEILKVSYDGLEENEKVIFLDMACFFKGYQLGYVKNILQNGRGFDPKYGIGVLVEKSLIKIHPTSDFVSMHDLIQDMGREIVRQESHLKPGEWSRLWCYEDILDVLQENKGTDKIEFIMLDLPKDEEVEWDGEAFKYMKRLIILIIRNARFSEGPKHLPNSLRIIDWTGYPSPSLPQDFHPRKLVILNLTNGLLALVKPLQKFKSLSLLDLRDNRFLTQVPDISGLLNLSKLNLRGCINLIEIHDSVGHLDKLRGLYATGCRKLRIFPRVMESKSLHHLDLSGCYSLQSFPEIFRNDMSIHVYGRKVKGRLLLNVPRGFEGSALVMEGPSNFVALRSSLFMLSKFDKLIAGSCEGSSKVISLTVEGCYLTEEVLVTWISCFSNLEYLKLSYNTSIDKFLCARLPCFSNIEVLDLTASNLTDGFSKWLPWFPNLVELVLASNEFIILPACINRCHHLRTLVLDDCRHLRKIREIPSSIKGLSAVGCKSLTSQSSSILLSQKLHEDGGTSFTLPGSRIPEWFDHCCKGSSLSFWFRKNFPSIALCFVHLLTWSTLTVRVHVNSHEMDFQLFGRYSNPINRSVEHVSLFDLDKTIQSSRADDVAKKEYKKDGWNHVEVEYIGLGVKWIGVHVYKQETNTEDVRFTDPSIGAKKRKIRFTDPSIGAKKRIRVPPRRTSDIGDGLLGSL